MPLSIWVAKSANWPEYGRMTPILTVPCAHAAPGHASNASAAALLRIDRLSIGFLLRLVVRLNRSCCQRQGWARLSVGRFLRPAGPEYCTQSMDFQLSRSLARLAFQARLKPASTSGGIGAERSLFLS